MSQWQDDLTEYADRLGQLTFSKSSAPAASFAVTESLKAKSALLELDDTEDEFNEAEDKLDTSKYAGGLR